MSSKKLKALGDRVIRFLINLETVLITLALAVGTLLALQSKQPLDLERFDVKAQTDSFTVYRLPIASYSGPVIVNIDYSAPPKACRLTIKTHDSPPSKTWGYLASGLAGGKKFLLFPGSLSQGGEIKVGIHASSETNEIPEIVGAKLSFPKAGSWLLPSPLLISELILFGLVLGIAAAALWTSPSAVRACYVTIVALMILVLYFRGLEFASRLAALLPAAVVLFLAAAAFRFMFTERDVRGES